jgi:hypothetical protein
LLQVHVAVDHSGHQQSVSQVDHRGAHTSRDVRSSRIDSRARDDDGRVLNHSAFSVYVSCTPVF